MNSSVVVNRRLAASAALAFLLFIYETSRVANQHLRWVPTTDAPQWARIGFHAAVACFAVTICGVCALNVVASMQVRITPSLTPVDARRVIVSRVIEKRMPVPARSEYTIRLTQLGDWRTWRAGAGLFVVTALPYWLLLALVGRVAAMGFPYLAIQAWHLYSWPVAGGFLMLWLVFLLVQRPKGRRIPAADKAALTIIAFVAGSESWTSVTRWKVSVLYSLWLQRRGIFPMLTGLTAVLSHRVLIAVYCRQIESSRSQDHALSYLLSIRVARLVTALAFYALVALIRERAHIW